MEYILRPLTIVPDNLYVERSADRQIRHIIEGMGRPGYVLVARQMGKTNLLLHTRKQMQNDREIFTFIDFSIIGAFTETECFNHIIDETINLHSDILTNAENEIEKLRQKPNYSGYKMFTQELRIILKYVNKLVFIFDEIDALARTQYSDRVFSTIRSHYFQRENYEELNKLTYILSGVIEPKNIIKDPNISPFNIGEKIYMNDFSVDEYETFIENTGIEALKNPHIKNRIYYWTKGNPRMTWDVCALVEKQSISTQDALDKVIYQYYLTAFDKVPIDAIRQTVKENEVLKDALIQLYFNKGDNLSVEVKNQLYLAGIIEYDNNITKIKNPILEKSLSYEWLMSLKSSKPDYLTEADHAIWMQGDYKKAITYLNHYLEETHSPEEIEKAYYLLGEAQYRSLNIDKAEKALLPLLTIGKKSKYYYRALLVLAEANSNVIDADINQALEYFNLIIQGNKVDSYVTLRALLGKVAILIKSADNNSLNEAEKILSKLMRDQISDHEADNTWTICNFYMANISALRGDNNQAVYWLDLAINVAQQNERQLLLYKKLELVPELDKENVAEELYQSLSQIESKPNAEDYDNPIAFTLVTATCILAKLILFYPQYDIHRYLRLFLFDTKENAVLYIDTVLHQIDDDLADPFFNYIKKLQHNPDWNFEESQLANIALLDLDRNSERVLADEYVEKVFSNPIHDISFKGVDVLTRLTYIALLNRKFADIIKYYKLFNDNLTHFRSVTPWQRLLFDYYYSYYLFCQDPITFRQFGSMLLNRASNYLDNNKHDLDNNKLKDIQNIINYLTDWLTDVRNNMQVLGIDKTEEFKAQIKRNSLIQVEYIANERTEEGKYKKYIRDIDNGSCRIVKVIRR